MMTNQELGSYLKTIRESLGYSTRDVNKLCNISQSHISLMENGKRRPSPIVLKKLSSLYFIDCDDLYKKAGYDELIEYVTAEDWNDDSKYTKTTNPDGSISYGIPIKNKKDINMNNLHQEVKVLYGENTVNLLDNYSKLNELGKRTADVYVEDLTTILKYTEKKETHEANG